MRISDWSSDVCSSDLEDGRLRVHLSGAGRDIRRRFLRHTASCGGLCADRLRICGGIGRDGWPDRRHRDADSDAFQDRKSTRLNSSTNAHLVCRLLLEKKKYKITNIHTTHNINM